MALPMDTRTALGELCRRAAQYSINLDSQVELDKRKGASQGRNALVYSGILHHNGVERQVAVKVFRSGPPGDLDTLKRIVQEVHLWSKLSHENIVRMLGISTKFDFTISIVSDWMEVGDAFTYVQNQENDPRPLIMDIARGLGYLHNHERGPILHGDLKGQNVLVSHDGRALLADFGFSTLRTCTFSLTVEPGGGGTIRWIAPEILDGNEISVASDIWAFGMTALELFTRLPPFHEKLNPASVIYRILQGPPDRPTNELTCSRLTDAWWDVCSRCWIYEPPSRPEMSEIFRKLDEIMVGDMSSQTYPDHSQFSQTFTSSRDQPPASFTGDLSHSDETRCSSDHSVNAAPVEDPTSVYPSDFPHLGRRHSSSQRMTTRLVTSSKIGLRGGHSMSCLHRLRLTTQAVLEVNEHCQRPSEPFKCPECGQMLTPQIGVKRECS
ncbi:hypothetical protein SCLCIDRAFT_25809 [Scleroderma citrinum Foug A]|uniref:Protein kinase domain-containing protein n=1 Tax=Scleroderma citrinum Foug A TaxID=1036808 RepID=A0A0C3A9C2_9AGAM|nr:hypothetical protein SCLCIDRAFT_25809 [Scleroderma citrinum Foug A]